MKEILLTLGYKLDLPHRLGLVSLFATVTCGILFIGLGLQITLPLDVLILHGISWVLWFCWQERFLPPNRDKPVTSHPADTYKQAFYRHILPGVSLGVAQMLRPLFLGLISGELSLMSHLYIRFLGGVITAIGLALLFLGFKAIGIAAAGFVYEYIPGTKSFSYVGVYRVIRHPLFFGGVLSSLGAALFSDGWIYLPLGLMNVAILPIYQYIEDRRSTLVIGPQYRTYRLSVGAFLPNVRARKLIMPQALLERQVIEIEDPQMSRSTQEDSVSTILRTTISNMLK